MSLILAQKVLIRYITSFTFFTFSKNLVADSSARNVWMRCTTWASSSVLGHTISGYLKTRYQGISKHDTMVSQNTISEYLQHTLSEYLKTQYQSIPEYNPTTLYEHMVSEYPEHDIRTLYQHMTSGQPRIRHQGIPNTHRYFNT